MSGEKPCPFCASGEVAAIDAPGITGSYVMCNHCGATGPKTLGWSRAVTEGEKALRPKPNVTDKMVNRFLSWHLPESVQPDACVMDRAYRHRCGTNLLTASEARAMLEHVLED